MFTEFVFGIYQDQSAFCSDFSTAFEQSQCILFQYFVFFGSGQTLFQDFFLRDVFIMQAHFGFSGWSNDWFGKFLVFFHSFGKFYTTDFTNAVFVSTPCATAQVTTDNHFHRKTLTHNSYGNHRIWSRHFPVGADVGSCIQKFGCNLVQHLSFVGNTFRQNYVECGDTVGSYHY